MIYCKLVQNKSSNISERYCFKSGKKKKEETKFKAKKMNFFAVIIIQSIIKY